MGDHLEVSVLMPVRNAERFVGQAIDSVLRQITVGLELLIINDGSEDGTGDIIDGYAGRDDRIRVVSDERIGLVNALEAGRAVARAPLLARMDADDVAVPDRLAKQIDFLRRHPGIVAVGGQVEKIDRTGQIIGHGAYPLDERACLGHLERGAPFCHPAVTMRAGAVARCGGYRHRFAAAEDYDLWLRLSKLGGFTNLPDVVLHYRIHEQSLSMANAGSNAVAAALALTEHLHAGSLVQLERHASHIGPAGWPTEWGEIEPHLPGHLRIFARTAFLRALSLNGAIVEPLETLRLLTSVELLVRDAAGRNKDDDLLFLFSRAG
ncbi:glycosyltransferase [Arvimicrobium flavum]|uniref:glycosyltransferase n=1 Tax=Arvimicrobium flavum TaxID=3393320 RepID=UPI00237A92E8|nr:glycosyltransferase [Mesorhizobium shangrilense]